MVSGFHFMRLLMPKTLDRSFSIRLFLGLLVALLAALPFASGLPGAFVLDDIPNIVNNDGLQLKHLSADALLKIATAPQLSGSLRMLPTLTFALDYWRAGGLDPGTFKATNILVHSLTTCALGWFFHLLLLTAGIPEKRARWAAAGLALAWAIHPLQVSSVLYVVQRMQTMGTFFLVLALLAYLQARRAQLSATSGRTALLVSALLWVVALGCKEDSVLLPVYTLALELTVLRFAAADAGLATRLRRGYMIATLAGLILFMLWVIPNNWHWEAYPARNFTTVERLLTQGRVLCLYLWQIVVPLPSHMPFYYDWLQPSRGLLQPRTTLLAIGVVLGIFGAACLLRTRLPLFSLGVFLFFGAHFITSNVIGLELAFEHRNHFAMIGAVLALGSLLAHLGARLKLRPGIQSVICVAILAIFCSATLLRANDWRSELSFFHNSTKVAPHSDRAWFGLCLHEFKAGGEAVANNSNLDKAITACSSGADAAPYALNSLMTLIVLKTMRGDIKPSDWARFQQRLQSVDMGWENRRAPLSFTYYARQGVTLDKEGMLEAFSELSRRSVIEPFNSASLGYFIMNDLQEPDLAISYFAVALSAAHPLDPFPQQLATELRAKQRPDLAEKVEHMWKARFLADP